MRIIRVLDKFILWNIVKYLVLIVFRCSYYTYTVTHTIIINHGTFKTTGTSEGQSVDEDIS